MSDLDELVTVEIKGAVYNKTGEGERFITTPTPMGKANEKSKAKPRTFFTQCKSEKRRVFNDKKTADGIRFTARRGVFIKYRNFTKDELAEIIVEE